MGGTPLNICIAIPSHGDWKAGFGRSLARMTGLFAAAGYDGEKAFDVAVIKGSMLPEVRHRCVAEAVKQEATHILFLDSDMKFPPDLLARLLAHGELIVGVNYPQKGMGGETTAYADTDDYIGPLYTSADSEGLIAVSHMGFGACLIDMRVFDAFDAPFFQFEPIEPHKVAFKGEDVFFFNRCTEAGISAYVDQSLSREIAHIGDTDYTHMFANTCREQMLKAYNEAS